MQFSNEDELYYLNKLCDNLRLFESLISDRRTNNVEKEFWGWLSIRELEQIRKNNEARRQALSDIGELYPDAAIPATYQSFEKTINQDLKELIFINCELPLVKEIYHYHKFFQIVPQVELPNNDFIGKSENPIHLDLETNANNLYQIKDVAHSKPQKKRLQYITFGQWHLEGMRKSQIKSRCQNPQSVAFYREKLFVRFNIKIHRKPKDPYQLGKLLYKYHIGDIMCVRMCRNIGSTSKALFKDLVFKYHTESTLENLCNILLHISSKIILSLSVYISYEQLREMYSQMDNLTTEKVLFGKYIMKLPFAEKLHLID